MRRQACRIAVALAVSFCSSVVHAGGSPGIDGVWSQIALTGPTPPPGLAMTALAYDSQRHRALYFAPAVGETWSLALDGTPIWSPLATQGTPPTSQLCAAFYHVASDRLIVVGDNASDVWALTLGATPTWSPISTPGRAVDGNTSFAYDAALGRVFEFGGVHDQGTAFQNTLYDFTVNGASWATLSTPADPVGRAAASMIYDPTHARVVIEGGIKPLAQGGNEATGETWAYSLANQQWTSLPVGPAFGLLNTFEFSATIYDPGLDRMIVFDPEAIWALSLEPPEAWTQLSPLGATHPGYRGMGAIYDPVVGRMVLFGGTSGSETWQLEFGSTPTAASLVSTEATPKHVRLQWQMPAPTEAMVERAFNGEWSPVADVGSDGLGRISYQDDSVTPGDRYGYRLRWLDGNREDVVGEVWIDVPRASGLQLLGITPNPTSGPMEIAFALPSSGDVRLDVFDVHGRRMGEVKHLWLSAGSHLEPLSTGSALPAGLYLTRLTYEGRSLWTRAVVTR